VILKDASTRKKMNCFFVYFREETPVIPKGGSTQEVINSSREEREQQQVTAELRKKENELGNKNKLNPKMATQAPL